jgi:8-oxo-dGTP diphosphatase
MKFVYVIAFSSDRFLMVLNPKRKGWEMPGGRVEEGENAEDAARREFREETGQEFDPVAAMPLGAGAVFVGNLNETGAKGEMRWQLFDDLPEQLAFPEVEYREQISWAKTSLRSGRCSIK